MSAKKGPEPGRSSTPTRSAASSSWWSMASLRRSLVVTIGTSSIGKGTIIANLPFETQNLFKAMITLTERVNGKEMSQRLENNIFKFLCELYSSHAAKEISYKDFLIADPVLREAFELIMKLYYYYDNNPRNINLKNAFRKVEELLTLAADLCTAVLRERLPHWDEAEILRLSTIVQDVGNSKFLESCWSDLTLNDPLFDLYDSMQKYNAFHYYSKSTGKRSEPPPELKKKLDALLTSKSSRLMGTDIKATQSVPNIRHFGDGESSGSSSSHHSRSTASLDSSTEE